LLREKVKGNVKPHPGREREKGDREMGPRAKFKKAEIELHYTA